MAFSILSFLLLSTFPSWHEEENSEGSEREIKPFPSRPVSLVVLAFLGISAMMTLLSVFWQQMVTSEAVTLMGIVTSGVVQVEVGAAAMGLGWAIFFLNAVSFIAILLVVLSLSILAVLTD